MQGAKVDRQVTSYFSEENLSESWGVSRSQDGPCRQAQGIWLLSVLAMGVGDTKGGRLG